MCSELLSDMTGLAGGFNINLEWTTDDVGPNLGGNEAKAGDSTPGPTIYTALRGIGLKLESRKAPVEILVVDHAEKIPTEN